MSNEEEFERRAILELTANKESSAYKRAVKAGVSVTYLKGSTIVCVQNGKSTVVGKIKSPGREIAPRIYNLKMILTL